jgi:hypothetical protein
MKRKTSHQWIIAIIAIILFDESIGWQQWATFTRAPLPEAIEALESDQHVEVALDPWLTFLPTQSTDRIYLLSRGSH